MRVLETKRMTLRWLDEEDAPFILALLNDPDWIANIGDRNVRTLEEARRWIAQSIVPRYWDKGHGLWAMVRRDDRALVGICGLLERDALPEIDVGYAVARAFRGNGYAREAALASLRYGCEVLGKRRILAIVRPENRKSIRVLESIGMQSEGLRVLADDPRETEVFAWADRTSESTNAGDAKSEIDALARRFFSAFSNRRAMADVASVPSMFLPEAVVTTTRAGTSRGVDVLNVRELVLPRATLLEEGSLIDFEEEEVASETWIAGKLASRSSRYRKAGRLNGTPFEGNGHKHFQLVQTARGWKIAALAWEDEPTNDSSDLNRSS